MNNVKTDAKQIKVSRKITIKHRETTLYPGDDTIPKNKKIGASFLKRAALSFDEEREYLQHILKINPKSDKFDEAVADYWRNIGKTVPLQGLELEIGFIYNSVGDKKKADSLNEFRENERYKYGRPINIADYILWRYCLVYSHVANKYEERNKSPKIRFYIHDEFIEKQQVKVASEYKTKAMKLFLDIHDDIEVCKNILLLLGVNDETLGTEHSEEDTIPTLQNYAITKPEKFIDVATNKDLKIEARIEKAIRRGVMTRLENTTIVMYGSILIGNTMQEAVLYFKQNKDEKVINAIKAKMSTFSSTVEEYKPDIALKITEEGLGGVDNTAAKENESLKEITDEQAREIEELKNKLAISEETAKKAIADAEKKEKAGKVVNKEGEKKEDKKNGKEKVESKEEVSK